MIPQGSPAHQPQAHQQNQPSPYLFQPPQAQQQSGYGVYDGLMGGEAAQQSQDLRSQTGYSYSGVYGNIL